MVDASYIKQIESLQNSELPSFDLEALDKVCKAYPCFQSAHILKAVYLKRSNETKFEAELPSVAVRVLNRSVLYDRVHEEYGQTKLIAVDGLVQVPKDEDIVDAELNEIIDKAEILQAEEAAVTEQPITEKEEEQSEVNLSDSDDRDNLKALVDEINRKRKDSPIVSKTPKTENKTPEKKLLKSGKTQQEKVKQHPVENKLKNLEVKINSFTDWLKHKKSVDTNETSAKSTEPLVPIDMAMSHEAELMREVKNSNFKLEDFLVNQIERKQSKKEEGRGAFTHAVSETYAKILVSQDQIQEAIDVYKELSIKYPKKSSNFARQIENLKNSK